MKKIITAVSYDESNQVSKKHAKGRYVLYFMREHYNCTVL